MGKKLSTKRIRSRYKDEWVLLLNPEISSETAIEGGEVVFHSKNRKEEKGHFPYFN